MQQIRPTFEEMDAMAAERERAARDCVARLSKILAAEFSRSELLFIWNQPGHSIITESFEIARND